MEYKVNPKPRYGNNAPPHTLLYDIINKNRKDYCSFLEKVVEYKEIFQSIKMRSTESNPVEPVWNNDYLPGLDIVTLYAMMSRFNPAQYVEIGSGNSTIVARKSIRENKLKTKITSIDPFPRASIDQLADTVIRQPLEEVKDLSFLSQLEENDILFIDNSHRSFPNSDVTVCFMDIIPKLNKGVIVQIHDIYLPYDYPQFMCDRFYSEQYLLGVLLMAAPDKYQILSPNMFISEDKELAAVLNPIWQHPGLVSVEKHGGSFWFQVK